MEIVITADSNNSGDRARAEDVAIGYARMFGIELQKKVIGGGSHACQNHKQLVGGVGSQCSNTFASSGAYTETVEPQPVIAGMIGAGGTEKTITPDFSAGQAPAVTVTPTDDEIILLAGQELVEVNGVKMAMYPVGYTPEPLDTAAIFGDQTAPVTADVPPPPIVATTPPPAQAPAPTMNVAPPAPSESAPPANVTASNPVSGVELDKDGIPWDARIHSTAKTKNADSSWRLKKGVDKEVVALVKEELKGLMGTPIAAKPDTPPPVIPPASAPQVLAPFPAFTRELAPHMRSVTNPDGKITPEYLNELAKYLGVVNSQGEGVFSMLLHRPDAIPLMRAEIVKAIGDL